MVGGLDTQLILVFVKFQLWKIEDSWYYTGKLDWVEEKPISKKKK